SAYGMPIAATTSRGGSVRNISVRRAISYMFVALPGAPAPEDCPCDFTKGACDDRVVRDTVTSQTRQVRTALRGPGPRPRPAARVGAGRFPRRSGALQPGRGRRGERPGRRGQAAVCL